MIARRIIIGILFILFILLLELSSNTLWGVFLAGAVFAGFILFTEIGVSKGRPFVAVISWVIFLVALVLVYIVSYPPVKRVKAFEGSKVKTDVVEISDGKVTGVVNKDGTCELFAGIPYAKAPVGDLRWKEPQDPDKWDGVRECDTFAPMSMQPRNPSIYYSLAQIIGFHDYKWFDFSDNYMPEVSEDALYVNLWRPTGAKVGDKLPVLVYIHGGSLQTGQPWYEDYRGENLVKDGIIVVNMGYRLGVYGFLALDELANESPSGTTGNYGLLDQIKALEWVRDNVGYFGGDPDNVTLAGESAGAACVSALSVSPLAKGLFKRTVLESSTVAPINPPHSFRLLDEALSSGRRAMEKVGAGSISDLRALPAKALTGLYTSEHHITVDGYVLPDTPYNLYKKGEYNEEAIFHGFNKEESAAFIMFTKTDIESFRRKVKDYFGDLADDVFAVYDPSDDAEADTMWSEIYGAVFFDYPHYCLNRLAVENGIPVHEYLFSKTNGRLGCWHSGEEVYLYANIPSDSKLYDANDREVMDKMSRALLDFVKYGDCSLTLKEWKQNTDSISYMNFGDEIKMITESERKQALYKILDEMNS